MCGRKLVDLVCMGHQGYSCVSVVRVSFDDGFPGCIVGLCRCRHALESAYPLGAPRSRRLNCRPKGGSVVGLGSSTKKVCRKGMGGDPELQFFWGGREDGVREGGEEWEPSPWLVHSICRATSWNWRFKPWDVCTSNTKGCVCRQVSDIQGLEFPERISHTLHTIILQARWHGQLWRPGTFALRKPVNHPKFTSPRHGHFL